MSGNGFQNPEQEEIFDLLRSARRIHDLIKELKLDVAKVFLVIVRAPDRFKVLDIKEV